MILCREQLRSSETKANYCQGWFHYVKIIPGREKITQPGKKFTETAIKLALLN
ncbi:hypothetical protein LYNGBM3L_61610 [Moorena producens 3L]|uniref:Uncharacterized protein n=1 Tax=Moorena producens 3L TaxID=489825 RepID=F4Y0M2_9CYAN|nr:hypothetical protein LYNGBM3L_61610 [Moorena producens 3L]